MSDLDRYDVEAMIRDALYAERAVWRGELAVCRASDPAFSGWEVTVRAVDP